MQRPIFILLCAGLLLFLSAPAFSLTQEEVQERRNALQGAVELYNIDHQTMIDQLDETVIQDLIGQGYLRGDIEDYRDFSGANLTREPGGITYQGEISEPGTAGLPAAVSSSFAGPDISVPGGIQKQPAAPGTVDYKTDGDTDTLQAAIDSYNQRYCPPNERIADISAATLDTLLKYELIKRTELKRFEGLIMRDGRVVRKVETQQSPQGSADRPDPDQDRRSRGSGSFLETFDANAKVTGAGSPDVVIGSGINSPSTAIRMREKKYIYRNAAGQLVEAVYLLPSLPEVPITKVKGEKFQNNATLQRLKLLQEKFRKTLIKPIVSTPGTPPPTGGAEAIQNTSTASMMLPSER